MGRMRLLCVATLGLLNAAAASSSSSYGFDEHHHHHHHDHVGEAEEFRRLGKSGGESFMVPQPMEFHSLPHAEPSVGGYRPFAANHYSGVGGGVVGVAPYTTLVETDDRHRLTSVMSSGGDPEQLHHGSEDWVRQLGKKKNNDYNFMVPQPMEFHNFPHAQPSVGGYRPPQPMLHGMPAQAVNVAPWTSIIETDDKLRLTSVMAEGGAEVISASHRAMREAPLYTWSKVSTNEF